MKRYFIELTTLENDVLTEHKPMEFVGNQRDAFDKFTLGRFIQICESLQELDDQSLKHVESNIKPVEYDAWLIRDVLKETLFYINETGTEAEFKPEAQAMITGLIIRNVAKKLHVDKRYVKFNILMAADEGYLILNDKSLIVRITSKGLKF